MYKYQASISYSESRVLTINQGVSLSLICDSCHVLITHTFMVQLLSPIPRVRFVPGPEQLYHHRGQYQHLSILILVCGKYLTWQYVLVLHHSPYITLKTINDFMLLPFMLPRSDFFWLATAEPVDLENEFRNAFRACWTIPTWGKEEMGMKTRPSSRGTLKGEGGDKNMDVTGSGVKGRGWVKTRMGMLHRRWC